MPNLEITVLSAKGLYQLGKSPKKDVFMEISADSLPSYTMAIGTESNGSLWWNQAFLVEVRPDARCLTIEVKRKKGVPKREVAMVRIPLTDILGESGADHKLQVMSYRLTDQYGEENGIVNFSVKEVSPPPPQAAAENNSIITRMDSSLGNFMTNRKVGKTLGEELESTKTVVVPNLKTELEESASSLKVTLEAAEAAREKMCQDNLAAEKLLEALTAEIKAGKAKLAKVKSEAEEKERTVSAEVEKCQSLSEEYFGRGLRQAAFFHGIPAEDTRYDIEKDVVEGKLVSLGGVPAKR